MGLTTFSAVVKTNSAIELNTGDNEVSVYSLQGQFDYSKHLFQVKVEHFIEVTSTDNNGDSVISYEEYSFRKPSVDSLRSVSLEDADTAVEALKSLGVINIQEEGFFTNVMPKIIAFGAVAEMLKDSESWFSKNEITFADITVEINKIIKDGFLVQSI